MNAEAGLISMIVRASLALLALACMLTPVQYARVDSFDVGFSLGSHGSYDGAGSRRSTRHLTFREVVNQDADEAWQLSAPLVLLGVLAWERASHRRARRDPVKRAPYGAGARLAVLLAWFAMLAAFTFDLQLFEDRSAAGGQFVLGCAWFAAFAGAVYELAVVRRYERELRWEASVALPARTHPDVGES